MVVVVVVVVLKLRRAIVLLLAGCSGECMHTSISASESHASILRSFSRSPRPVFTLFPLKFPNLHVYALSIKTRMVPDPYYGGADGFDKVLDLLEDACEGLLASM